MKTLETIGGRIGAFLVLLVIIIITSYFYFMNNKETEVSDAVIPDINNSNIVVLQTNFGEIEIELFGDKTPKTVENFKKLAKDGFYNGVKFHRVIKGFMIQTGDPLTKDDSQKAMWGMGGPGYSFEDEIASDNSNMIGTIAMANAGPNTNGSQFFINTADNNFLNQKHTVFGKVVSGMAVVAKIENVQTGVGDVPVETVVIENVVLK